MATQNLNLTPYQSLSKRSFDLAMSFIGLVGFSWLIFLAWIAASLDTRENGFFIQKRVGKNGLLFNLIKIKTMRPRANINTNVTISTDPRITKLGKFFRKTKIDELPQLWNVLKGDMSFVGPRPDVPGFADQLAGEERSILNIRPGITGPATLKYRDEEMLLERVEDPEKYNLEVIFPDKVKINLDYIRYWSFTKDIKFIWKTVGR